MKLFFRQFGEGDPLVILHGLFGLSDNWVTIAKNLARHYTVFLPDLRNHGQSPHSRVFTLESMVEDLEEFIHDIHQGKIVLMGHSLGGLVSMYFALYYPEKVRRLIVVDISLRRTRDYSEHQRLVEAMKNVDFSVVSTRSDVERKLAVEIPSLSLRQFLLKNVYWRDRDHLGWRLNLDILAESLPLEIPGTEQFKPYPGECLIIRGGNSDYVKDEDMAEILALFPKALFRTVAGAGHWVHADAPEEFLQCVSGFTG